MLHDGALYCGPEPDTTRYYSGALGSTPTGDFFIAAIVQMEGLYYGGDPAVNVSSQITIGQNFANGGSGTSGGNCYLWVAPLNAGVTANKGKIRARLSSGANNMLASGSELISTSAFANGDVVLIVLQSNAGTMELWTCKANSTPVLEASGARNGSFTTGALGTWHFGDAFAGYLQTFLIGSQALTSGNMQTIAANGDPDSIVSAGNRLLGWSFDTTGSTVPAVWGSTSLTLTGSMAGQVIASPVLPNASQRLAATQPVPYGAVSVKDDGTAPSWALSGSYTGFTPSTFQAQITDSSGSVVQAWTDLTGFTASAGSWSGTLPTVPVGGLYRLAVRDKTTTSLVWQGGAPWSCCPVTVSIGQSPHVYFDNRYKGSGPAVVPSNVYFVLSGYAQIMKATQANSGSGFAAMANAWNTVSGGKPLLALQTAVVGTSSSQWAAKNASVWPQLLAALDYAKPTRVLFGWLNGASDATTPAATIKSNLDTIVSNLDSDVTTTRGIGYRVRMLIHNRDSSNTNNNRNVRAAQYEWATGHALYGSKVLLGVAWLDMQTDSELVGTAQAGTSNTITLAASETTTGALTLSGTVQITGGTGAGQTATVSSYNTTSKVLTITGTWTTVPDATSTYRVTALSPHPSAAAGVAFGPRYAQDTANVFGYATIGGRGPVPVSALYLSGGNGQTVYVTFTHRHGSNLRTPNGGTSATGLAGFQVFDGASQMTISDARVWNATTVRLTLSAAPSAPGVSVRYGALEPVAPANFDSVGGGLADLLYDDSGVGSQGGLPAYMTLSTDLVAASGTAPSQGGGHVLNLVLVNGVFKKIA